MSISSRTSRAAALPRIHLRERPAQRPRTIAESPRVLVVAAASALGSSFSKCATGGELARPRD